MIRADAVELRLLRTFVVLAEELNFGRAADRLNISQPALSAQVRQLEQRLGMGLFDRNTRRVSLTPAGAALLAPARTLLAESARFAEAVGQVRGRPHYRVLFGAALYTAGIPERDQLLDTFFEHQPNLPITVTALWQRDVSRQLLRGEADLALMLGTPTPLAQWEAEPSAEVMFPDVLPRLVLRKERIGLLLPKESPLARFDEIPAEALIGVRIAMLGGVHGSPMLGPVREVLGRAGAELIVPPESNGRAVERYARQFRMPAVSLGWFGTGGADDPDMVWRPVEGLTTTTELALVRSPVSTKRSVELLWEEALERFPDAREA